MLTQKNNTNTTPNAAHTFFIPHQTISLPIVFINIFRLFILFLPFAPFSALILEVLSSPSFTLSLFFLNGASRLDSPHPIPSWNRVGLWARIPPPLKGGGIRGDSSRIPPLGDTGGILLGSSFSSLLGHMALRPFKGYSFFFLLL